VLGIPLMLRRAFCCLIDAFGWSATWLNSFECLCTQ
jgi:hypothetical protein